MRRVCCGPIGTRALILNWFQSVPKRSISSTHLRAQSVPKRSISSMHLRAQSVPKRSISSMHLRASRISSLVSSISSPPVPLTQSYTSARVVIFML